MPADSAPPPGSARDTHTRALFASGVPPLQWAMRRLLRHELLDLRRCERPGGRTWRDLLTGVSACME
eukprot:1837722-Prymnesium_polylepis.1